MAEKLLPENGKKIKFRTCLGWFIGEVQECFFSYGGSVFFFNVDHIPENRHWTYFTVAEIFEWYYIENDI